MLYIRSLDLFIQQNCNFVYFDQHLSIYPISQPLVNTASMYLTSLDSSYEWDLEVFVFSYLVYFT